MDAAFGGIILVFDPLSDFSIGLLLIIFLMLVYDSVDFYLIELSLLILASISSSSFFAYISCSNVECYKVD